MKSCAYERALGKAEQGVYYVGGATVPWLLTPLAAVGVRAVQSAVVAGRRRKRRRQAEKSWGKASEDQQRPLEFGDVVLLRSFGNDGGMTVGALPVENLIVQVATALGYGRVCALACHATDKVPGGPSYRKVGGENWKAELARDLEACSAIIVLLHESTEFREGFAFELAAIKAAEELTRKTVLVGPCRPTISAYRPVLATLSHLDWPTPQSLPLACLRTADSKLAMYPAPEQTADEGAEYQRALVSCLRHTPDFSRIFQSSS